MCTMAELKAEHIGDLNKGIDGTDRFYQVWPLADGITLENIRTAFERHMQVNFSSHPGAVFCSGISVVRQEYSEHMYIVTVHLRYDC